MEGKVRANVRLAHSMTSTLESQPTQSSRYVPWRPTSSPAGEPREFGLYNGVSNRARGWKSKTVGQFVENQAPAHESMRRWDGATKTWQPWDYLRRDPELWLRNGNCYIHLYGVGQSRRGPAFRIPFSALLDAGCQPLLDRYLVTAPARPNAPIPRYTHQNPHHALQSRHPQPQQPHGSIQHQVPCQQLAPGNSYVQLYISAPPQANTQQAFLFHVATRNFFAWLLGRPLVGKNLGSAMIGLLNTMMDFRCHSRDNVSDLLFYLNRLGYLDMRNQPHFALAILHLAEFFHLRDLYIDAFSHCTGMCDRLFLSPEYQNVSSVSRKLIRRAKSDLDCRLRRAGGMLKNFLEEDLSEAHLGLTESARIHLRRFRSFLHAFYIAKFGSYPPGSYTQLGKEPGMLSSMRRDFECLYRLLVNYSFNTAEDTTFLATGGICTLQCIQSFDMRHKFGSLPQPLPMMPDVVEPKQSRRKSWLGRDDRSKIDYRLLSHAALIKATNMDDSSVLENNLVRAYRKFEEDFIFSPTAADKPEKLSQIEARKVRWILIYCTYQTLRSVTEPPSEVRHTLGVSYHLAVTTDLLPPWREDRLLSPPASSHRFMPTVSLNSSMMSSAPPARAMSMTATTQRQSIRLDAEIKPDIDYFALAHATATSQNSRDTHMTSVPCPPRRSRSVTRAFPRTESIRRSLSIFSKHARAASPAATANSSSQSIASQRRRPSYHEIVIHGYGNGTNSVHMATEYMTSSHDEPDINPVTAANRSLSNASKSSDTSAVSAATAMSSMTNSTSVSTAPSSAPSICEEPGSVGFPEFSTRDQGHENNSSARRSTAPSLLNCPEAEFDNGSLRIPGRSSSLVNPAEGCVSSPPLSVPLAVSSVSADLGLQSKELRSKFRRTIGGLGDLIHRGHKGSEAMYPSPLAKQDYLNLQLTEGCTESHQIQDLIGNTVKEYKEDTKPVWEQFADLGGLTKLD